MTTAAKTAANCANALQSTGPRTVEGKTRSSMNAVRHGILSRAVLLPDESPEEFESFAAGWRTALMPVGEAESALPASAPRQCRLAITVASDRVRSVLSMGLERAVEKLAALDAND